MLLEFAYTDVCLIDWSIAQTNPHLDKAQNAWWIMFLSGQSNKPTGAMVFIFLQKLYGTEFEN